MAAAAAAISSRAHARGAAAPELASQGGGRQHEHDDCQHGHAAAGPGRDPCHGWGELARDGNGERGSEASGPGIEVWPRQQIPVSLQQTETEMNIIDENA